MIKRTIVFFIIFFTGCATYSPEIPQAEKKKSLEKIDVEESSRSGRSAVSLLLQKAREEIAKCNWTIAHKHIERAYRIRRDDPVITLMMAKVLFGQREFQKSEQWAQLTLSLIESDRKRVEIWEHIARCRLQMGDRLGSNQALEMADQIRSSL